MKSVSDSKVLQSVRRGVSLFDRSLVPRGFS